MRPIRKCGANAAQQERRQSDGQADGLKENGLEFHCQIVLCPGVNDGNPVLKQTIEDLASLWPASRSLAIVPVGLTKHRDGLAAAGRV